MKQNMIILTAFWNVTKFFANILVLREAPRSGFLITRVATI